MKSMLITGATSGIGYALATLAADRGYQVIACGRNQQVLEELQKSNNIETSCFDVTDLAQTRQELSKYKPDISVLNAGTCEYVDVDAIEPEMFRRVFEPNFFGVVNCLSVLVPNLKSGSHIVFVDSMARLLPFTRAEAYGASKAALHYLCKSLDVDLASKGIFVQSASPGFVKTPLTDKNDFEMPMMITAEQAAVSLLKSIEKKQRSSFFPTIFGWIMRLLSSLPASLQRKLSQSMKNHN